MRVLDLFCGAGGAGMGYADAGFDVVGWDISPQPRYPFEFHRGDALALSRTYLRSFDLIHASPPCQRWSVCQRLRSREHPALIAPTRMMLMMARVPYVIENVPAARAELRDPFELCGCMFPELNVYRARLFETSWCVRGVPPHAPHDDPQNVMGRPPRPGQRMHVVGNFSGVAAAREAMGIEWMTRDELREAIPPAYTRWVATRVPTPRGRRKVRRSLV